MLTLLTTSPNSLHNFHQWLQKFHKQSPESFNIKQVQGAHHSHNQQPAKHWYYCKTTAVTPTEIRLSDWSSHKREPSSQSRILTQPRLIAIEMLEWILNCPTAGNLWRDHRHQQSGRRILQWTSHLKRTSVHTDTLMQQHIHKQAYIA